MGYECTSIYIADHGVTLIASFLREGKHLENDFWCDFLIGKDGAESNV